MPRAYFDFAQEQRQEPAELADRQREYAWSLRSAEEHGLTLESHKSHCCGKEVWLTSSAAPLIIECPFCGSDYAPGVEW